MTGQPNQLELTVPTPADLPDILTGGDKERTWLQLGPGEAYAKPLKVKVQISASGSGQMQPLPMNEFMQQALKECFFDVALEVGEWNAVFTNWREGAKHANARGANLYEFVPEDEIERPDPTVLWPHELEVGRNYVMILSNASGLYRYNIGDVVRVVRLQGRTPAYELDQFAPIALISADPTVLVVREDGPYKTLKDLVDAAKARPGTINYGSSGVYGPCMWRWKSSPAPPASSCSTSLTRAAAPQWRPFSVARSTRWPQARRRPSARSRPARCAPSPSGATSGSRRSRTYPA